MIGQHSNIPSHNAVESILFIYSLLTRRGSNRVTRAHRYVCPIIGDQRTIFSSNNVRQKLQGNNRKATYSCTRCRSKQWHCILNQRFFRFNITTLNKVCTLIKNFALNDSKFASHPCQSYLRLTLASSIAPLDTVGQLG